MIGCAMRRLLLLLFAITQIGAAPAPADSAPAPRAPVIAPGEEPLFVPLVAVIANPERYDGKLVTVEGFLNLEFEGNAIYLSRSDFEASLTGNSVWVEGPKPEESAARRALRGHYVFLTGRYNATMNGHMGLHTGTFEDVSSIWVAWSRVQAHASIFRPYQDLPWPGLIVALLVLCGMAAVALRLRAVRNRESAPLAAIAAVLAALGAVTAFSIVRLWAGGNFTYGALEGRYFSDAWPTAVELLVGLLCLPASWYFLARREYQLCMLCAVGQLVVPAAIEARGFYLFDVPVSIRSAQVNRYDWRRADPLLPVRPAGDPHRINPPAS